MSPYVKCRCKSLGQSSSKIQNLNYWYTVSSNNWTVKIFSLIIYLCIIVLQHMYITVGFVIGKKTCTLLSRLPFHLIVQLRG